MKTESFDYALPKELIAQEPSADRQKSRLMVINRAAGSIEHRRFYELPEFLSYGDVLVVNNTKVIPARLIGTTGKKREVLLVKKIEPFIWETMIKPSRGLTFGDKIIFADSIEAQLLKRTIDGTYIIKFSNDSDLSQIGFMPLPPYIKRDYSGTDSIHNFDKERYQTVYAENLGAIAAPTAGLHFTKELIDRLNQRGIYTTPVTLHVGWGTFRPVRAEFVKDHKMFSEWFRIPEETIEKIKNAKRVIAVGTTTVRALESGQKEGFTDIFIYPPYKFKVINSLITNFHLPKSTLLMLVSAFAGRELIMKACEEAIKQKYRFYSYGDAMMII